MTRHDKTAGEMPPVARSHASVATWLGVLFLLTMLLMLWGGFVRLSGSGLSLPGWPFVDGSLLPPLSEQRWSDVYELFQQDLAEFETRIAAGEVGHGSLGHRPATMAEFKVMFFIEWTHRLLAMLVGLVALGCMTVTLRRADLRAMIGPHLVAIVSLVVLQAVLGGILVHSGTKTLFLFLHLGMATGIIVLLTWSILRMLAVDPRPVVESLRQQRRSLTLAVRITLLLAFVQIILGAMVAGSRAGEHGGFHGDWPLIQQQWVPQLWHKGQSLSFNLFANATLHQWVHRWFAWSIVIGMVAIHFVRLRQTRGMGHRARLGLYLATWLIVFQVALGIANVFITVGGGPHVLLALSHLAVGLMFVISLVLVDFDLRYESVGQSGTLPSTMTTPSHGDEREAVTT